MRILISIGDRRYDPISGIRDRLTDGKMDRQTDGQTDRGSACVNRSVAGLLNIECIGCESHQLAFDVKEMLNDDPINTMLIEKVHETMTSIKSELTNAALLRQVTDLKAILNNDTHWSGTHLKRLLQHPSWRGRALSCTWAMQVSPRPRN